MKTVLIAAALLGVVGAVGCGGSDGSGQAATYVYPSGNPATVPAGFCILVNGPFNVGTGWMHYAIDDLAGTDTIRAVIISDTFFSSSTEAKCGFTTDQTVLDVSFAGSNSGDVRMSLSPPIPADNYDFVVTCENPDDVACAFNLTWAATY